MRFLSAIFISFFASVFLFQTVSAQSFPSFLPQNGSLKTICSSVKYVGVRLGYRLIVDTENNCIFQSKDGVQYNVYKSGDKTCMKISTKDEPECWGGAKTSVTQTQTLQLTTTQVSITPSPKASGSFFSGFMDKVKTMFKIGSGSGQLQATSSGQVISPTPKPQPIHPPNTLELIALGGIIVVFGLPILGTILIKIGIFLQRVSGILRD